MYDIKQQVEKNHPDIDLNATNFSFIKSITDLSIKSFLLELEQGQVEVTANRNEIDEQHIFDSDSESNLTSTSRLTLAESSFASKSTANHRKELQGSVSEDSTIIETVNKGMEKLLMAINDFSQHVKGCATKNKDVERNLRMSNDFTDIATKWDQIDNIVDISKAFPQICFLPSGDTTGGSVILCETCYNYIKSPSAPDRRGLSG